MTEIYLTITDNITAIKAVRNEIIKALFQLSSFARAATVARHGT
jgi:hypothetical protein